MPQELSIHPGFIPVLELLKHQNRFGNSNGEQFYVEDLQRETVFGHEIEVARLSQLMLQLCPRLMRYANRQRVVDLSLVHDFGESEKGDDSVFSQHYFTAKQKKVRSITERIQALKHINQHNLGVDVIRLLYSYDQVLTPNGINPGVEYPVDALLVKTADSVQGKYRYAQQTYMVAGADLATEASQPNTFLTKIIPRFRALYGIVQEHYHDEVAAQGVLQIAHSAIDGIMKMYGPHEQQMREEMRESFQQYFPELVVFAKGASVQPELFECLQEFGHEYAIEDALLPVFRP